MNEAPKQYLLMVDYGSYEGWKIAAQADTAQEIMEAVNGREVYGPWMVVKRCAFKLKEE